jgi:hypothetical protein
VLRSKVTHDSHDEDDVENNVVEQDEGIFATM